MERHGYHRLDLRKINVYHTIIISNRTGVHLLIALRTVMCLIPCLDLVVSLPYGRKTGRLGGHYIYSDSEIRRELIYARSHEFHDLVLDIAFFKGCSDYRKCNILRTYTLFYLAVKVDSYHARSCHVICSLQELLCKLAAAFTDSHGTQSTVTCVTVRTKNHGTALCKHLSCKLVDDRLMRRHIHTTVALGT